MITPDGTLDRATLRREIFAEPVKRGELETLLHPLIQSRLIEAAHNVKAPYCVISVPLLVESGWTGLMDRVLVVDVSPAIQRERAMIRDGLTVADAEAIMRTQATREQRLAYADDVIRNDGDIQHLRTQVQHLHRAYGELAARHSTGTDPR